MVSLTKVQPLQSLAACGNTKLRSLIWERKIQASMPATASAQFLARTPPSHCSPVSRASSSAEVFHTTSTFSESRTGFFSTPLERRAAAPALHFSSLLCQSQLQSRELLTQPKPSSRSAGQVSQMGRRRGWMMAIPLQTRYQQPHRSPTCSIYPLSRQLHSIWDNASFANNISLYPIVCMLPYSPCCLPITSV